MQTPKDVVLTQLLMGGKLIDMLTADLTDVEYFTPAATGTNHTAWVLGHLARTEDRATAAITGAAAQLPTSIHDLFAGGSPCHVDTAKYPACKEIADMFGLARTNTLEAIEAADVATWTNPSPDDYPKEFFPTIGAVWGMMATHQFWHIGQITTCRTIMKKKPVLM